ncbi:Serine/threonine-protein kinase haspin [Linnemannia gamsii]|uniref:non-specific serine/threonine protein kinase n=1 Tax=Linnemannia gamsii TaxID=64522 RepID=A0ABQ7JS91_9FUNG|nr:Serine/threonine-protein kinase haspin [Linnemannia gamsii]
MLGPASLRSQQPAKSSLKTYGGRRRRQQHTTGAHTPTTTNARDDNTGRSVHGDGGKAEDSRPPSRQFDWDRLERDRKARLERQAKEQERLAQEKDETAFLRQDVDLEALLYSDHEDQFEEEGAQELRGPNSLRDPRSIGDALPRREYVPSTQRSNDDDNRGHYSQTKHLTGPRFSSITPHQRPFVRTRGHRPVSNSSSHTTDADLEFEVPRRASATTTATSTATTSILSGRNSIGRKSSGRVSFTFNTTENMSSDLLGTSQQHKVMLQESPFFEQDFKEDDGEEEEDDAEDEVLFRTPSFDILKKLRELPTPKIPEPRANPFGFRPLSSTSGSTSSPPSSSGGQDRSLLRDNEISTPSPQPTPTIDIFNNPFMSPESPTAKRAMEILRKREQQLKEIQASSQAATPKGSMDVDKADQIGIRQGDIGGTSTNFGQDVSQQQRKRPSRSRETTPERISAIGTSRSAVDGTLGYQDEIDELALGKRISSIEITPRRLLAKQRKTISYDSDSPTRSLGAHGHVLSRTTFDDVMEEPPVRPFKLFLDRDIPKDEDEDEDGLDLLFAQSRHNRRSPPLKPISSTVPNKHATGSDPNRLLWPPKDDDRENRRGSYGREIGTSSFKASSATDGASTHRRNTFSRTHWLKSPSPERPPLDLLSNQDDVPFAPPIQKSSSEQRQQPQQPPQTPVQQQQHRPIRSLRRPQAVLVNNSKKAVFKPTVVDLLSICDQHFFDQFQDLESADRGGLGTGDDGLRKSKAIVDFDMVLPKCMTHSLTKIGEASFSEVYTVDLPIQQQEQRMRSLARQSPDGTPNLFQSPRLNTYVKESADDDLNQQDMSGSHAANSSGRSAKLVMKVLPFYDESFDAPPSGMASPMKGARRNKSKAAITAATELLALEDIYREVTVSTQIMHGWKGFIDHYTSSQLYCIILLPYGGIDLEHCLLTNWRQAWTVLTQVAASLESKEQAPFWFEHRDLHWGNILVKGTKQTQIAFPRRDLQEQPTLSILPSRQRTEDLKMIRNIPTFGIVVQMIDFTLARVQGDKGNLIYMDLEKDEDLFRGQGDYQFDIYRKMRRQIGKDWTVSCSRTNLFWLHYIADKLLSEKNLEEPTPNPHAQPPKTTTSSLYTNKRASTSMSTISTTALIPDPRTREERLERWCYERVLAISEMNLDRLDPSGQTPSGMVLDQLLLEQPS